MRGENVCTREGDGRYEWDGREGFALEKNTLYGMRGCAL